MRKILLTGGAGFIGSHVAEHLCNAFPSCDIVVLDKMTYAADFLNLSGLLTQNRIRLVVGDICDYDLTRRLFENCDLVVHTAAESHVDRSFHSSIMFTQANTLGTHTVMEACRAVGVPKIIHVSTDEVYGEVLSGDCDESQIMNPTNPYSASKAAAEMIVNGYRHSFKLPVITVRANNIFGTRQFPEKLIPRTIMSFLTNKKMPLHGNGENVRHYLAVQDFSEALSLLINRGELLATYNIGSPDEYNNKIVVRMICEEMGINFDSNVEMVPDRPFNDRRYAISWDSITNLGWAPKRHLKDELPAIVRWYKENKTHILSRLEQD